jgi:hypothetical protein
MTIVLYVLGVALVIIGLAGIILPALPGHILIFAGLVLAAWAEHFTRVGVWTLVAIAIVGASSFLVDFVGAAVGAKRLGASTRAMVGAVIGELTVENDLRRAGRAGVAAWIGFAIGTAIKVALAFVMIGIFVVALVF